MISEFHIINGKSRSGPHDLMAIVRKIRNGSLTAQTPLELEGSPETKPAAEWPQLAEFFQELSEDRPASTDRKASNHHSLGKALEGGWRFLQRNQYATVYSGILVLLTILAVAAVTMLPPMMHAFGFMILFVAGHLILCVYLFGILRMSRGQPVEAEYLQSKIGPAKKSLFLSSLFVCVPCMLGLALLTSHLPTPLLFIGLFIFAVPGLLILALYAFTPLLILDKDMDFWDAMEGSRKTILKNGFENVGVVYALFVLNFVAGLFLLLPLAITLPITMGALVEIYDDLFS